MKTFKKINLANHVVVLVDDADFEWLNQWKWHLSAKGYAATSTYDKITKKNDSVYMHRLVNNTPSDKHTDHINGNKLDNRRKNLRTCTPSQNQFNKTKYSNNTSGFKGVNYVNKRGWAAKMQVNRKRIFLGYYSTKEEAARVYFEAAQKYHGEYASS